MVKRIAAHYIYYPTNGFLKLHYVELNSNNCLSGIYPLLQETANTSFFNGVLLLLKEEYVPSELLLMLKNKNEGQPIGELLNHCCFEKVDVGARVSIYILDGVDLLSAKLSTSNSGSYCHIQRLC